jgi:hypothetical protein
MTPRERVQRAGSQAPDRAVRLHQHAEIDVRLATLQDGPPGVAEKLGVDLAWSMRRTTPGASGLSPTAGTRTSGAISERSGTSRLYDGVGRTSVTRPSRASDVRNCAGRATGSIMSGCADCQVR